MVRGGAAAGSMHVLTDAGFRPEGWYGSTSGGRRLRSSVFSPTTGALCVRRCLLQPCGLCPHRRWWGSLCSGLCPDAVRRERAAPASPGCWGCCCAVLALPVAGSAGGCQREGLCGAVECTGFCNPPGCCQRSWPPPSQRSWLQSSALLMSGAHLTNHVRHTLSPFLEQQVM
jgi:hypothetical protein